EREPIRQCIIFCQRKRSADKLYRHLREEFDGVATMHGDLQQSMRDRIMQRFREGKITFLVATDVVGRGIDVLGISHIINYDIPGARETYVHGFGGPGRRGADGVAIAFVTPEQGKHLTAIECFINKLLEKKQLNGFEPVALQTEAPAPAAAAPEPKA